MIKETLNFNDNLKQDVDFAIDRQFGCIVSRALFDCVDLCLPVCERESHTDNTMQIVLNPLVTHEQSSSIYLV